MKIENNPKRFFTFIVLSYTVFIFIVIQVLSWSLYYSYEKSGTKLTNSLAEKNLDIAVNNVQKDLDTIKLYCQQLFIDKDIISLMYGDISDQQKLNAITYRLTSYSVISSYIYSIYVYNKKYDYFYCTEQAFSDNSDSFFDKDIQSIIKEAKVTDFKPFLRSIPNPYNPAEKILVYSLILYDKYSNKASSDAALIVNIKTEPIVKLLDSLKYQDNSSYLVLSTDGTIVSSSNREDFFKNIKNDKYMSRIINNINGTGSFTYRNGSSILYTRYRYSPVLKWSFVNTTPYDILYGSVEKIKYTTLVISLLVLVIAIFVSLMLSRNINIPVKNLIRKTVSYEKIKKDNYVSFRHEILVSLHQKGANFKKLSNCFKEFNIKLDLSKDLVFVHIRVDNASGFYETYDIKDRKLMLFSVGNIVSEILGESFVTEPVESDKEFLDILINVERNTTEELNVILKKLLLKAQEEVSRLLKISISFTIGNRISELQCLSEEYSKIVDSSNYRLVTGHSAIIFSSDINPVSEAFIYSANNEKQLFDFLLLGKLQEACTIYNEMVQLAVKYSYNDIIRFLTQLALSLNTFINKLNNTVDSKIDFEFYRFGIFLNKAETIIEINTRFELLFSEICGALEPGKEDKNNELVSIVNDYLGKNYHDPNLSINMIADHLDKSPTYLGRLYKKLTGVSIPDYINELRLKKSMELLSAGPAKIEDICNSIGFPNEKYFYLFFKKHVGITPNEYRNRKIGKSTK